MNHLLAEFAGNTEYENFVREFATTPFETNYDFWGDKPIYSHPFKSLNDWPDRQIKNLEIIQLKHMNHEQISIMGEQAFNSIHGTLTNKAIGMLMILAYNLMDDNGFRLMKKYDPVLVDIPSSIPIEDIQDHKLCKGQMKSMLTYLDVGDSDVFVETCRQSAIGYCYLAASYLRLFTKSADNYLKADKHLKGKFRDFYKFKFSFDEFHPDMDVIMAIKKQFELDSRFRNTLYVILSSGRAEPQGQIIKDFLYEIHLKYTGLHTYALYLRAMQNLDVNCDQLGKAMHVPMFEPQLSIVSKLLELEHSKESEYSRHMWKFGRLFDKNFMSVLQIKHCATFRLVLAYIVSETSDSNKEGPLKIAGLKDASQGDKDDARPIAARAMRPYLIETAE
ncbi:coat protein [Tanacetum coccineum]